MKIVSLVLNSVDFDSRVKKTARTLVEFGDVEVIGLRGHEDVSEVEHPDGYVVRRPVKYTRRGLSGIAKTFAQATSYAAYVFAVVRIARHVDVVVCNDVGTLPIGALIKLLNRSVRIIYDSHEYQAHARWVGPIRRGAIRAVERACLPLVDAFVVVSRSIAAAYAQDFGIREPRVVMNCPPYQVGGRTGRLRGVIGVSDREFILLYQGGLTEGRGLEAILSAFMVVRDERLRLVFMGFGPLERLIRDRAALDSRIVMVDAVAPEEVLDFTADADFGLCVLPDDCLNHRYCLPNKLFEYLMAGIPVLANDLREVRAILEPSRTGVVASLGSLSATSRAIRLAVDFDRSGLPARVEALRQVYCWEMQEKVWRDVFRSLGIPSRRAEEAA